uniref:Gamma-interferon-inducible lysosomal thiol reductase n=1 Tax=Lygus hesperus TaxID=30085 RepID=A0A146LHE1_LYGHE
MIVLAILFMTSVFLIHSEGMSSDNKVHLRVYYESRCPFCRRFFANQLKPTSLALSDYMETHLVPFGNTDVYHVGKQVIFSCQHTYKECRDNIIQACALARMSGQSNLNQVLMASCILELADQDPEIIGPECCKKFGLDWSDVSACTTGPEGTKLMLKYANETISAKIHGVPHTTIDGHAVSEGDLKKSVCDHLALKGITPVACKGVH